MSYTAVVAFVAALACGLRITLPLSVPVSVAVGIALLPVAVSTLRAYRGMTLLATMVAATAIAGVVLTVGSDAPASVTLTVTQTLRMLSLALALIVLLWARSVIGLRRVILAFGCGLLVSVPFLGVNHLNPWKFSFGLPATLILLSLAVVYRHRLVSFAVAVGLAAVSIVFDSRSAAGFLLIAAAITLTAARPADGAAPARRRFGALLYGQIAIVVVGAFYVLQGAILEGMLGEELQSRTEMQLQEGGSVLTGGRPEMGASAALITANPWGYGAGSLPTPNQILVAKDGMAALGYDPDNGYVEHFMFGTSFEVHSGLGDLWILFGPVGAALGVICAILLVRGTARGMATGSISTIAVYLVIRALWDLGFSPLYTSITLLPLTLVAVAVRRTRSRPAIEGGATTPPAPPG